MTFNARAAVSLSIAIFAAIFLITAFDYNAKARLLPVVVTSGLLIMALVQLASEIFPDLARYLPFLRQQGLLVNDKTKSISDDVRSVIDEGREIQDEAAPEPSGVPGPADTPITVLICVATMAGMLVLIQFVPYWVAVPVFLMVMLTAVGRQKLPISLAISLVTGLVLFGLFDLVLNARI